MITTTAAHTAVRAANAAGKQVTVALSFDPAKYSAPAPLVGTARWTEPTNPNCRALMLYGVLAPVFQSVRDANGSPTSPDSPGPRPWSVTPASGDSRTQAGNTVARLEDIDSIATASASADTTLGTTVITTRVAAGQAVGGDTTYQTVTTRQPDPAWQYGTGLE